MGNIATHNNRLNLRYFLQNPNIILKKHPALGAYSWFVVGLMIFRLSILEVS